MAKVNTQRHISKSTQPKSSSSTVRTSTVQPIYGGTKEENDRLIAAITSKPAPSFISKDKTKPYYGKEVYITSSGSVAALPTEKVGVLPSGATYNISEASPAIQKGIQYGGGLVSTPQGRVAVSRGVAAKLKDYQKQQMAGVVVDRVAGVPKSQGMASRPSGYWELQQPSQQQIKRAKAQQILQERKAMAGVVVDRVAGVPKSQGMASRPSGYWELYQPTLKDTTGAGVITAEQYKFSRSQNYYSKYVKRESAWRARRMGEFGEKTAIEHIVQPSLALSGWYDRARYKRDQRFGQSGYLAAQGEVLISGYASDFYERLSVPAETYAIAALFQLPAVLAAEAPFAAAAAKLTPTRSSILWSKITQGAIPTTTALSSAFAVGGVSSALSNTHQPVESLAATAGTASATILFGLPNQVFMAKQKTELIGSKSAYKTTIKGDKQVTTINKDIVLKSTKGKQTTIRKVELEGVEIDADITGTRPVGEGSYTAIVKDMSTYQRAFGTPYPAIASQSKFSIGTDTVPTGKSSSLTVFNIFARSDSGTEVHSGLIRTDVPYKSSGGYLFERTSTLISKSQLQPKSSTTINVKDRQLNIKVFPAAARVENQIGNLLDSLKALKRYKTIKESGIATEIMSFDDEIQVQSTRRVGDNTIPISVKQGLANFRLSISKEFGIMLKPSGGKVASIFTSTPPEPPQPPQPRKRYQYLVEINEDLFRVTKTDAKTGERIFTKEAWQEGGKYWGIAKDTPNKFEGEVKNLKTGQVVFQQQKVKSTYKSRRSGERMSAQIVSEVAPISTSKITQSIAPPISINEAVTRTQPIVKTSPALIRMPTQRQEPFTIQRIPTTQRTIPIQRVDVIQKTTTVQRTTQRVISPPSGFGFSFAPPIPPIAPPPPPSGKLGIGWWGDSYSFDRPARSKSLKTQYNPSVEAVVFDIKGVKPLKSEYKTGLSLRPLTR